MTSVAVTSASRSHIPAVCRIPNRGSACLVAPGVLLTSVAVVGSKYEASKLKAVFFEGTKKDVVQVKLEPERLFFNSIYPEHLDYCLIGCETKGLMNVAPVTLPVVKSQWSVVREGDTLLIVQHPIVAAGEVSSEGQVREEKRFEEVVRCRDDLMYLKTNGTMFTAGCPAFNDQAELVGIQSQFRADGEGLISRVVSIVSIVKHLFANGILCKVPTQSPFGEVWDTWFAPNDCARIISIMTNFKSKDTLRGAAEKLCEHTAKSELMDSIVACGGTKAIVSSLQLFKDDELFVVLALRSLWNISFGDIDNRDQIVKAGGISIIQEVMKSLAQNEDVARFSTVLLFNITMTAHYISVDWAVLAMQSVLGAMCRFSHVEVLQKFGCGFLTNVISAIGSGGAELLQCGIADHLLNIMKSSNRNVYLMENIVQFFAVIAQTEADHPLLRPCIAPIIDAMTQLQVSSTLMVHGNHALWNLGRNVVNRVAILKHPQGLAVLAASSLTVASKLPLS